MKKQLSIAQKQNEKLKKYDKTHCPLPKPYHKWTIPQPSHPLIICSNNTMILISLAQMRLSNGCVTVRNDNIFNLHLESSTGPWFRILCLLQDTSHVHWLHTPKQSSKKKQKILKKDQTPNKSYRIPLAYVHKIWG